MISEPPPEEKDRADEEPPAPAPAPPARDPEERSLEVLEWARLCEALARMCGSDPARDRALALRPLREPAASLDLLEETAEAQKRFESGDPSPVGGLGDVSAALDKISHHALLEPRDLLDVAALLERAEAARRYFAQYEEEAPRLARLAGGLDDLPRVRGEIRRCLDPSGHVKDEASPELARSRRRIAQQGAEVRSRLDRVLADPSLEHVLQDRFFTLREGRYVVPVRSDARTQLRGIVHGRSSSGASFFVEPEEVVEANNELRIAEEEEREELSRILGRLSGLVGAETEVIGAGFEILVHLDLTWAKARMAHAMEATVPAFTDEENLDLPAARHPLLVLSEGGRVVPNDIRFGEGARFLVVTGPNTGGKTVAIKTAGLAVLMARAGMAVPVAPGARLHPFPLVLADIGDEQSIEEHLSSFSGHLRRILEIRDHAGPGTLVLLDEVVSGTDPQEGAALARALLEDLVSAGARGMATTHYQELKGLAAEDPRFRNAGMEFDLEGLRPTFRLLYDLPGRSSALETARRLGLPPPVVARAEELHGEAGVRLDALIDEVEELRRRVEEEQAGAAEARREVERIAREKEEEVRRLRERDQRYLGEEEARLAETLARAREEVARKAKRLEAEMDRSRVEETRRRLKEIEKESRERIETYRAAGKTVAPGRLADLREGDTVWLPRFNKKASVLRPPGDEGLFVAVGAVRVTVPLDEVELAARGSGRSEAAPARARRPAAQAGRDEVPYTFQLSNNSLDLRGKTVEDTLLEVDAFLDRSLRKRITPVVIIHGHGTGALRRAVREFLRDSPYVSAFRPGKRGEGEDGVTIVSLS